MTVSRNVQLKYSITIQYQILSMTVCMVFDRIDEIISYYTSCVRGVISANTNFQVQHDFKKPYIGETN